MSIIKKKLYMDYKKSITDSPFLVRELIKSGVLKHE